MKTIRQAVAFAAALHVVLAAGAVAASFTPGNLVVVRLNSTSSNATATFLDEYTTAGALVQSIALPIADAGAQQTLTMSGSATSEGFLLRSLKGNHVTMIGYDAVPGTTGIATSSSGTINRVVGRVDASGNVDTTTALNDASTGSNPRSAISNTGSEFWVSGGAGGPRYASTLGATTSQQLSTTPTNLRVIGIFGEQLYTSSASGAFRLATIGAGVPTTSGQTTTNLPGFPTATGSPYGYFFADLTPSVAGVDTVYVCDDGGTIQKYSLVSGSWTANGTKALASVRGVTGIVSGTSVTLYVTNGASIQTLTDTTGYNVTIGGTVTSLATAPASSAFRGIAFTPTTTPTVSSINRVTATPTNAASVQFTVTFSESVTGVDATDFSLNTTGVTGASITGVTGSGSSYTVTVNTGSGDGQIRLDLTDNDSIINAGFVPLGGAGTTAFNSGSFTTGQTYAIDKTAPAVSSIVRASADPTNAATVNYTVTFNESVTGVDAGDFSAISALGASVSGVSGGGSSYTVSVNTGSGSGTLRLDFISNGSVADGAGNLSTANFTTGEIYTIDKDAPTVSTITRVNGNPTAATTVDFLVTFSESVVNVDSADFALSITGVAGASVTGVTGSGATRTVTVNTGSGNGTIRLDVVASPTISDVAGNAMAGGFTGGEVYTVDKNAPTVSSVVRANANPTNAASVDYTVTFSQSVTGVDTTDFTLNVTGLTGTSVTGVTGSGTTWTVTVNTGSGDGTLKLDVLNDGTIKSGTNVPLSAPFTGGEVYTVDRTAPTVSSLNRTGASPTNAASVQFTATFSESVTGVTASTFALAASGVTGASITGVTGGGTTWTVTVNTGSGEGTIGLNAVADAAVLDLAGNAFATPFTGQVYTIDRTAPTVVSIDRASANPSSAATVDYTVTFSEAVTGVDNADFTVVASGLTGTSVAGVTGSGATRTVTVNTGTGDGTLHLDLVDNDTITDLATNPLGGSGAGNGNFTGQTYTIDKNAPTVVSVNRAAASPTSAASVSWTVTFSESVTGVDALDFALAPTGTLSGTSITGVTGSGATYTVTANSGSGDGTLGLNVVDDDSIIDGTAKPLGGAGAGNGNFTGQLYTIDHTAPTVVSINRASASPTAASSVGFTVTFSEPVTGVGTADFALAVSGLSGASITGVTGSGAVYTVTASTGTGNGTLGVNLVDDDSIIDGPGNPLGGPGAGNGNFTGQTYTVNRAASTHLVISQVYGGGGNGGATFRNDFIELFNPTGATVNLTGWSVQYGAATGSTWQVTNLIGSIAPGHYYLVQESSNAAVGAVLPTPDASANIAMAAGAGKVALVNQTSALSGACPLGITVIDFVGYGSTANCSETLPTAAPSATVSVSRIDNGCTDTDHNNTDFTAGAVNPRNSASPVWSCGSLVGNGTATPSTVGATASTLLKVTVTPGQSPASTGLTVVGDLTPIGGSAAQTFFDDGSNGDVTPGDNIFSFNAVVGAATTSGAKTLNVAIADAQGRSGASTIALTILGATNPSGTGGSSPASVAETQTSLLTVAVTPGQNPPSTGITVTANLTAIGGSASQTFFDDGSNGDLTPLDGTFSFNATVAVGTSLGAKSLPATINDAQGRVGSVNIPLNVQSASAPPAPTNLAATPGNAQVALTWTASAGATGYNVYRSTTSGFYTSPLASNVVPTNYTDNTAANGTLYFYVVKATNGTESGPSNEVSATPAAPPPVGSLAKIYFIDIGQGASTLIQSPTGKTLLVDGGPTGQGTTKVVPLLNTLGISAVDFTVLTHYHIDHDDGLTETINAGKVAGTSYDNGDTTPLAPPNPGGTKTAYQNYINALASHSGTITRVRPEDVGGSLAGTVIDLGGGMKATILAQGGKLLSGGAVAIDNSDLNTESISVLVEYNNFDFLVSGDLTGGGSTSTAKTPDVETFVGQLAGDIDIVEYDHHGSTTANNPRFLRLLKAEAAVAETGFTNTFGHPNRETVNKYLNIPATTGNTYGGTALPNPGNGPVSYQTDPSPATDDRVSRQGYSGAAPANAGNGTILLETDGTTSFTMKSFDDAGARISPAAHAYSLDGAGAGVTTNFPPTVISSIAPVVPLATDSVLVQALVNDREDPITSVNLNYAINGVAQAPVTMTLNAGNYEATIAAQPDGTRVDYTVTAVAGGKSTSHSNGYFAGTTPISSLRVLDALGEPLYLDYAARIAGTATSDTNVFSVGTNDDYIQDATGGINIWRTIQPSVPAVQNIASGNTYLVAGRIGELAGRFHLETTPPFASPTTPYTITQTGSATVTPAVKTIAQIIANPESLEAQLVRITNCTITSGTIPSSPASADAFLTITDGTGSFQIKVDKDTDVPGFATPAGAFTVTGIIQQDDFLRPFDSGYNITPRSRVDLGGSATSGPGLISIADARIDVDGSGFSPGDYVPDLLNTTVHVQGVVTSINFRQSNGSGIEYYIQDPTAGVDVFSTATTRSFNIGDNLDVIATVKQFNGLTEIDPGATTSNLVVMAPGSLPAVSPQLVTLSQLADNGVGEPLEGRLLRINNVTLAAPPATWVASTNYVINDSSGSGTIRISASANLVGQAPPAGTFSIMGVLGQFDSAAPLDSGYQLFPRSTSDILPAVPASASISATAGTPQSAVINTVFATQMQATVRDAGNAVISGAGVTFTAPASGASGTFPGGATNASVITDGSGVATAPPFTANATTGSYSVTATSGAASTTFSLTNLTQPATHFSVTAPANVTSGVAFNVTVTALDGANATAAGYTGTVHFSSGSNGTFPADYTFVGGDAGSHTFSVTLTTIGAQTIDVGDGSISGSANVTVGCPALTVTATNNGPICDGGTLQLDVTNVAGATYSWTGPNGFTSPLRNPSISGATTAATGLYSVTVTDNGCPYNSSTTATVNPNPNATITAPASVTTGSTGNTASVANAGVGATYTWTPTNATITAGVGTPNITFTAGVVGTLTLQVTVTTSAGCSDTKSANVNVTVLPSPSITSVTPAAGKTTGGKPVTISGTLFQSGATVTFGGSLATGVVVVNSTTITATTPAHAAGAVNVTVTNTDTTSATLTNGYTFVTTQFDANGDNVIDPADIFYLVNYLFLGGAQPAGAAGMLSGDANGDGVIDAADIFYLVNYLFLGGPAPASAPSHITPLAVEQPFSGHLTLGQPVRRGNAFVVPVVMTADAGSEVPQALSLRVTFPGDAIRSAVVHRAGVAGGFKPAFEFSRRSPNALSYLVSYDPRTSRLASGVVAEIEIETFAGARANIDVDPAVTLLGDAAGTRTATVAGGTLHVSGATIDSARPTQPHPDRKE
jgi:beta-lactamase superfamily II metal-dependent hydrolase